MSFDEKLFFRDLKFYVSISFYVFKTQLNIYYGAICNNSQGLLSVNYFRKKDHILRCLTRFWVRLSIFISLSPLESPLPTILLSYQFFSAKSRACWFPSKHSSWWRRLEDVFCLHLQKTSSRHLDQDEYIHLNHTSSEYVFKMSWIRLGQDQYIRLGHTSSILLEDIFKTSSWRLQDIFKMSCQDALKTSSRRFKAIFKTSYKDVFKTFSRSIGKLNYSCQRVFETYSTSFWDVLQRRLST